MTVRAIPLSEIDIIPGHNFREDMSTEDLEESLAAIGLLHPIHVIPRADGQYLLNSGERRLRAAQKLGWTEIDARVLEIEDQVILEMAAIDENIIRRDLRGASLDRALARRKELYLERFPETAQYVAGAHAAANPTDERAKSFTEDTADKTGKSPRTIERSVRRAERLSPATMEAYEQGLISQTQADILAGLPHDDQGTVLNKVVGKSVEETRDIVSGQFPERTPKKEAEDRTSMQHLEELYMHGQKLVAALTRLRERDDLDTELVDSVMNLADTLDNEFALFESEVRARLGIESDDGDDGSDEETSDEGSDAEFFPTEPPF